MFHGLRCVTLGATVGCKVVTSLYGPPLPPDGGCRPQAAGAPTEARRRGGVAYVHVH